MTAAAMNESLRAFVSLLAITNPIVAAPIFLGIVAGLLGTRDFFGLDAG